MEQVIHSQKNQFFSYHRQQITCRTPPRRKTVDKELIAWNIKLNSNRKLFVPIPSESQIKLLFSQALNKGDSFHPLQTTKLSNRKARVKKQGFKRCSFNKIKDLKTFDFNNEVKNLNLNLKEERKRESTDVSRSEEKRTRSAYLHYSVFSSSEERDDQSSTVERKEKQRVSEAKKMVREVMKNIKICKEKKRMEHTRNSLKGNLADFESAGIQKLIRKSKQCENKARYFQKKLRFFIAKIGKKINRSIKLKDILMRE